MGVALWIVQGVLAVMFLLAGVMKTFQPMEKLQGMMPWTQRFAPGIVCTIGLLEILGALGLILPLFTGILPWLTLLAAVGLALAMVGAAWTHIAAREYSGVVVNLVLLALALFVAYGRWALLPVMA